MRFWPKKGNRILVVGIFQSVGVGRAVLQNLHRARFRRAAAIYASAKGRQRVEEHGISAIGGSVAALILSVVLGAFIFWARGMLGDNRPAGIALPLAAFAFGGAITGWILVQMLREHVDSANFARFTNAILSNETVVVAEVEACLLCINERSLLVDVPTQHLAQREVHHVCRGVVAHRVVALR